jgi:hypothetical protein
MVLTFGGLAAGLIIAASLTGLLSSLLYGGVKATDPLTLAGVSLLPVLVTLLASYIPRAARVKDRSDCGFEIRMRVIDPASRQDRSAALFSDVFLER